jgi:YVTN family beta-propeller protein
LNSLSNDLAVVDTIRQSLFTVVPVGLAPRDVAVKVVHPQAAGT